MSASQVSSFGRWTQDCQRRRPGCRLGTGWWLWLGRRRGGAGPREEQCPRSGRRAPESPLIVVDPKADRFFSMVRAEGPGLEARAGMEQGSG